MAAQGHPRSLILAPIESAYATSYSYWSSIVTLVLARFRDIAGFLLKTAPHPCSTRIYTADVGASWSEGTLNIRVITFELTQPICLRCTSTSQADRRTTYTITIPHFALCASRGKKTDGKYSSIRALYIFCFKCLFIC